jgi:transcriptional regulator with XRE-family HTH domain
MGTMIRYLRRKSGLTQREIEEILGTIGNRQVARHENARALPSFLTAIGYQIIFRASSAELFPGAYETVRLGVEERLVELQQRLQAKTATGRNAAEIARKLVWLEERKSQPCADSAR